eukprot:1923772-Rhodomonas_salina.1
MSYEGESRRSRSRSPRRDGGGGGGGPPPPSGGGGGGFGGGGGGEASKLYVGNLSFQCQSEDLREYFSSYGKVEDATVVMDRDDPATPVLAQALVFISWRVLREVRTGELFEPMIVENFLAVSNLSFA